MKVTTTTNPAVEPSRFDYVLVLHDGTEKDILGIWGPYASEAAALQAKDELSDWPLDGAWDCVRLKRFPVPAPVGKFWGEPVQPTITWNNGNWTGPTTNA